MGRRGRGDCNMGGSGGLQEVTYAVPADKCGLVIGKGEESVPRSPSRGCDIVSLISLLFE